MGNNLSQLDGCFELSNPVTVTRNTGADCNGGDGGGGDECTVDGGSLTLRRDGLTTRTICAGDGESDPFTVVSVGASGANFTYVVTSSDGEILMLSDSRNFDFETAGGGNCQVWGLSFDDGLSGAMVGNNVSQLDGCFDLSNPVTITRLTGDDCPGGGGNTGDCDDDIDAGNLSLFRIGGTTLTICADDGMADRFSVIATDFDAARYTFVVTDTDGSILIITQNPNFDFEGTGAGNCRVYGLAFEPGLVGNRVGNNLSQLDGCFELSNPVTVTRNTGADCNGGGGDECTVEGGTLALETGGATLTICAGDGTADPFSVVSTGASGANLTYVVTSSDGEILMLSDTRHFDFETAGAGNCQVWRLSFDDGLSGAMVGNNVSQLDGCFDLSNPVTVTRNTGDDCDGAGGDDCILDGGNITLMDGTTARTICAGDGVADPFSVVSTDVNAPNFTYIVTDVDGNILVVSDSPEFDFETAGGGACRVYGIGFKRGLAGNEVGNNLDQLDGCFDLSNAVTITRNTGADCGGDGGDGGEEDECIVDGGDLSIFRMGGTTLTICAGDGIADPFSVIATDFTAPRYTFVVTDADGNILNLTNNPNLDFETAGPGNCRVYGMAFDVNLVGNEIGNNLDDLEGCFDLSNPVIVTRNSGADCGGGGGGGGGTVCEVDGGTLTLRNGGTAMTICAGDGIADPFSVLSTDVSGASFTFLVTDENGSILDLSQSPNFDFETTGGGNCQVWGLAFESDLTGATVGNNVSQLDGCFDLSNPVTITRNTGSDCAGNGNGNGGNGDGECDLDAGDLSLFRIGGTTLTICADDGQADRFSVIATDFVAPRYTFVVTNSDGLILMLTSNPNLDFEGIGAGTCSIYGLAFEVGLTGAIEGSNLNNLNGCFDLSNPVVITRNTGADCGTGIGGERECDVTGGSLSFDDGSEAIIICADGSDEGLIDLNLTGNVGSSLLWVITDANGIIVGLPSSLPLDFRNIDAGICLIWGVSHQGELIGARLGSNAFDFEGCFGLSNFVTVERNTGENCQGSLLPGDTGVDAALRSSNAGLVDASSSVQATAGNRVSAFPNPFLNTITVEVEGLKTERTHLQVMDITGRVVLNRTLQFQDGRMELNTASFIAGTYILRLSNAEGASTLRIVKR